MLDRKSALQQSTLFKDLPPANLTLLAESAHLHTIIKDELLFRQGEPATTLHILVKGRVRLVQHTSEGKDVTMATFTPGDAIGVVVALSGELYPGSAEALENLEVVSLPGEVMWQVMNDYAPLAVRVLRMVAGRLHEAHERVRELSVERTQQRIARALLRLVRQVGVREGEAVRLDVRLSRQDVAQLSGTTLETVSRTFSIWERDGVIEAGREQLTILNPHALVLIAEDMPRSGG